MQNGKNVEEAEREKIEENREKVQREGRCEGTTARVRVEHGCQSEDSGTEASTVRMSSSRDAGKGSERQAVPTRPCKRSAGQQARQARNRRPEHNQIESLSEPGDGTGSEAEGGTRDKQSRDRRTDGQTDGDGRRSR
ncbi:hypothetical protein Dda_4445 [Drechslerella dactyloides]|uniref:Uncharacterized protein n=1 Tax=Drechslerella dactyloides TaxID=74499 RepID=A0AAD6J147_DREDA|nr:hypothetical protein Dda_4445 [Drechslerella dactyloides]